MVSCFLQNIYAQLLPLALLAPIMLGMGGGMGGTGMPPMPAYGMLPVGG